MVWMFSRVNRIKRKKRLWQSGKEIHWRMGCTWIIGLCIDRFDLFSDLRSDQTLSNSATVTLTGKRLLPGHYFKRG